MTYTFLIYHQAPENFLGKPYGKPVDAFSFGVLVWEMLHCKLAVRRHCNDSMLIGHILHDLVRRAGIYVQSQPCLIINDNVIHFFTVLRLQVSWVQRTCGRGELPPSNQWIVNIPSPGTDQGMLGPRSKEAPAFRKDLSIVESRVWRSSQGTGMRGSRGRLSFCAPGR